MKDKKEIILWRGKPDLITRYLWLLPPGIIIALVIAYFNIYIALIGIMVLIVQITIDCLITEYILTNKRIEIRQNIIWKNKRSIDLDEIRFRKITKTWLEKKCKTGTFEVSKTGYYIYINDGYNVAPFALPFYNIKNPEKVKQIFDHAKKKFGLKEKHTVGAGNQQLGKPI
ncbi:MAG: PH domain-containing protein [Nanoarchaeota archaeon]